MNSLNILWQSPYNKRRPLFALIRFIQWKLIRIFKLKNVKYRIWNNRSIILNYDSFQCMWIMYNYWVDWEEFNLIKNYIKSGDTVFDIGANMGFYTIWMSKFIGNGKIHAFEPDSENFERLKKNIKINNLIKNVVANKIALSNLNGIISFTKGLDGENHIADSSNQNTLQLQSQKIDSYLKDLSINPSITYMKIDVEGFEYAVLKGADAILLNNQIEIIQIEINKTISNSGKSITDLLDLLNEYQYSLCRYDVENNLLISTVYADSRENYFAVSDLEKINFKLKHQTN